jgi:copper chaperone NosL
MKRRMRARARGLSRTDDPPRAVADPWSAGGFGRWTVAACFVLADCQAASDAVPGPKAFETGTLCSLDGMALSDYPGPKAQIHYHGRAEPDFFCDTVELLSLWLRPEYRPRIAAIYVQDMGRTEWNRPRDHWIDARSAWYVKDSRLRGSMGPTLATFAQERDARAFAQKFGGSVLAFGEITPAMAVLDGGALHDQRM